MGSMFSLATPPAPWILAVIAIVVTGAILFVSGWAYSSSFSVVGRRQSAQWRKFYLLGILRQDVVSYDCK